MMTNNTGTSEEEKRDHFIDHFPKSERLTAAFLLFLVLIWGIYESVTTGTFGAPWYIIIATSVFNSIVRRYYTKGNKNKNSSK